MSDSTVIEALKEQGRETRNQLDKLSGAMTDMAKSVSALTTTLARVEERHAAQDELIRRIGRESNDHEQRIRVLEKAVDPDQVKKNDERITALEQSKNLLAGSWKALTVVGGIVALVVTAGLKVASMVQGG